jgi:hypothetical protein
MTAQHQRIYKLSTLEALPTLSESQADDLKIETLSQRIWLSRMTIEDGMSYDNQMTVEQLKGGYIPATRKAFEKRGERGKWVPNYWQTVYTYEAIN